MAASKTRAIRRIRGFINRKEYTGRTKIEG